MKTEVTKKSAFPYKDAFFKSVLDKVHGNLQAKQIKIDL